MKKVMSVMLGLSLTIGSAAIAFGQDKAPTKEDSKDKSKDKDNKGKDDKGKDNKVKDDKGKN
jgi:hypothetical protein